MITRIDKDSIEWPRPYSILGHAKFLKDNKKIWTKGNFRASDQPTFRDKPYEWIKLQTAILEKIKGKIIVEIGSSRVSLNHHPDNINLWCCNDGHSTQFWAMTGKEVHTVDVDNLTKVLSLTNQKYPKTFNAYQTDGITFLQQFNKEIDFLFLDYGEVSPTGPSYTPRQAAESHMATYMIASKNLADRHIIGIDDTDVEDIQGKGQLLIPYLIESGYTVVADGRQTILVNFDLTEVEKIL